MAVQGVRRSSISLPPVKQGAVDTLKQLLYASLTIRGVDRTKVEGSYWACVFHALLISVVAMLMRTGVLVLKLKGFAGPLLYVTGRFFLLFFILALALSHGVAYLNCYLLGIEHDPLDTHIVISTLTYMPLLVALGTFGSMFAIVAHFIFWGVNSYYFRSCYTHVMFPSEREAVLHSFFTSGCMLGYTIIFPSIR